MIFAITIALISILILGAIVIIFLFNKPQYIWEWIIVGFYTYNLVSESIMLTTSLSGIHNHSLANLHTLVFGIGMLLILRGIWQNLLLKEFPLSVLIILIISFIGIWAVDNFILHTVWVFNPLSQAIIFFVNLCITVYLLNIILFAKKRSTLLSANRFLIIGLLIYCFANVLIDSFFNFHIELPVELYNFVSDAVQVLSAISHLFILLSVIWISKTRKYILQ